MMFSGLRRILAVIIMHIERMSLAKKLILLYIIFLAIPILVLGIHSLKSLENTAKMESLRSKQQLLQQEKTAIERNIDICSRVAQTAISNKNFVEFIYHNTYSIVELIEFSTNLRSNIQDILNANPDVNNIKFYLDNPYVLEIWPSINHETRFPDEGLKNSINALNGRVLWKVDNIERKNYTEDNDPGVEVASLYREIVHPDNSHIGILEVNMLQNVFFGNINDRQEDYGYFLWSNSEKKQIVPVKESGFLEMIPDDESWFMNQLLEKTSGESGNLSLSGKSGNMEILYVYIEKIDSYLYQVSLFDTLDRKIDGIRKSALIQIIGIFLLLSMITYGVTSILLKKLKAIVTVVRKVQVGELDVAIPVSGYDEIGELAYHFRKMMDKIKELIAEVIQQQTSAREAEIRALHSQINRHFIYNSLDNIKMMAEIEYQYRIADAVAILGKLLRYGMNFENRYECLENEIEYIRNYIMISNIRNDFRIDLNISIGEDLMKYRILKMMLQPVVENAVIHGIQPMGRDSVISITAEVCGDMLCLHVIDNGSGMSGRKLEQVRKSIEDRQSNEKKEGRCGGIGLRNVNQRMKLYYGGASGIDIQSRKNEYTRVTLRIPFEAFNGEGERHEKSIACR